MKTMKMLGQPSTHRTARFLVLQAALISILLIGIGSALGTFATGKAQQATSHPRSGKTPYEMFAPSHTQQATPRSGGGKTPYELFAPGNPQQVAALVESFVGTWILPSDDPEQGPSILTLHADGTLLNSQVAPGGNTAYQGIWVATGERSATFTMKNFAGDNTTFEYIGEGTIRGTMELSEDDTLLAQGTLEAVAKSGERVFLVSLETEGIRMHIEPSPKN
jgi:hypothetical protein